MRLRKSTIRLTAAFVALAVFVYWPAVIFACAVDPSNPANYAYQPHISEMTDAFQRAAAGTLGSNYPSLPYLETGTGIQPGSVPCVILKAAAYVESAWKQATYSTARGTSGPALVSGSCGYGVMQITSGMTTPAGPNGQPSTEQYRIATEYTYNIAYGAKMLVDKWNAGDYWGATIGNRDPTITENWYYAVWAYNYYGWYNNPNNPKFDPYRTPFNGTQNRASYPYQELVWGYAANPPSIGGVQLWDAVPLTLPARSSITDPAGWIATPEPSHQSPCSTSASTLQVTPQSMGFMLTPGQVSSAIPIQIASSGGPLNWTASSSAPWLSMSATSGTTPSTIEVWANAGTSTGLYNATITITAPGGTGSPKTIQVSLAVVSQVRRSHLPGINNSS